jgi:hypothetical protein
LGADQFELADRAVFFPRDLPPIELSSQRIDSLRPLASIRSLEKLVVDAVPARAIGALRAARPRLEIQAEPGDVLPNNICHGVGAAAGSAP